MQTAKGAYLEILSSSNTCVTSACTRRSARSPGRRSPARARRGRVLQTTKVDVKARGIAAIVGNIVADAAGTPTHWVYDQASLASQVANAGGEDKIAFMDPPINPFYHCPGRPGRLSALSVFHSKSVLYGVFVWARRVLNRQKWRFPARAVTPEGTLPSISVQDLAGSAGAGDPEGRKSFVGAPTS